MRESGVWTYGVVNLAHILGIAMLFGAILVLDLRLLGMWRSVPLPVLSRPTVTLAACGFLLAAATGIPMFATKAVDYAGNPFLFIKFPLIALALLNVLLLHSFLRIAHLSLQPILSRKIDVKPIPWVVDR